MGSTTATNKETTTGRIVEVGEGTITLAIPGSSYKIKLACDQPIEQGVGDRISGVVYAKALRMHSMSGGGRFIEPVWGEPRIVAGVVREVDAEARRVLINVAIPMWMQCPPEQDMSILQPGAMATCYVESGTRFVPSTSA